MQPFVCKKIKTLIFSGNDQVDGHVGDADGQNDPAQPVKDGGVNAVSEGQVDQAAGQQGKIKPVQRIKSGIWIKNSHG